MTGEQLTRQAAIRISSCRRQEALPPTHARKWQPKEATAVAAYMLRHSDEYRLHEAAAEKRGKIRFRTLWGSNTRSGR
jgi:hypothetical protein